MTVKTTCDVCGTSEDKVDLIAVCSRCDSARLEDIDRLEHEIMFLKERIYNLEGRDVFVG
jgi:hypothetical protein